MVDPRAPNCQRYAVNGANQVVGVYLEVAYIPSAQYELVKAELIDEPSAAGTTVATCTVLDKRGIQTAERVWLAWPYPGLQDGKLLPGNPNGQHMIVNGYTPPEVGPLGLYVGDAEGRPISDIIGGLGLPLNRHVSYRLTWQERGVVSDDDGDDGAPTHDYRLVLGRIADTLDQLAQHLGA